MSAGDALSHSQVVEWILGSRIQSHWPCITLWPISMFSMILETDSPTVPDQPCRRKQREQQHRAAAQFEFALKVDDASDVVRVALAATVEHLLADGVEFTAEVR